MPVEPLPLWSTAVAVTVIFERTARRSLIVTFTPAGIEKFFEETLERTLDPTAHIGDDVDAVAARYAAAAPRYGLEFLAE